jgi:hypothetical protein
MMNRTQLYLGGLLVLQLALILLFRSPFTGASTPYESRALWPELEALTPRAIELSDKDEASLRIERSGDGWTIASLDGFPADGSKVEELLGNLQDLRVRRPVVSSGRYHDAFKVAPDDHEGRVRLWADGGGDPDVDMFLGSSPNFRTAHVRRSDEEAVYEVSGLSSYDLRPAADGWIERGLVDLDPAQVVGLQVTNASGGFELARLEGAWIFVTDDPAQTPDPQKVERLLSSVASLQLAEGVGAVDPQAHGFASPAATVVIRYTDGALPDDPDAAVRELTVQVGGEPTDNESRRYVTRDGFPFTGTVWESSVSSLLEETVESLVGS